MLIFLEYLSSTALNFSALLSVLLVYLFLYKDKEGKLYKELLLGLFIGLVYFVIISNGTRVYESFIYDARSVLSLTTAFHFSPLSGTIGLTIGVLIRLFQPGSSILDPSSIMTNRAIFAGLISLVTPYVFGIIFKYILKKDYSEKNWQIYLFSLIVEIILFNLIFLFRSTSSFTIYYVTFYLVLLPLMTLALNYAFTRIRDYKSLEHSIVTSEGVHKAAIDSIETLEIFSIDKNYDYIFYNHRHEKDMKEYYNLPKIKTNFLEMIDNPLMRQRYIDNFERTFKEEVLVTISEVETTPGKFIEERYTPIVYKGKQIGVTVLSYDVTNRINREEKLQYLSYSDILTSLKNRTHASGIIKEINSTIKTFFIIYIDINGLKEFNDNYGHAVGDELIKLVAEELNREFFSEKLIARIGGDEFFIFVEGKKFNKVEHRVNLVADRLKSKRLKDQPVTFAYGISFREAHEDINEVIKEAEHNMYLNKNKFHKTSIEIDNVLNILDEYKLDTIEKGVNVKSYARKIGEYLELSDKDLENLETISTIYDVGKIIIPSDIINKKEELTKEDWSLIKLHSKISYYLLSNAYEYRYLAIDVLHHHERYDGTGYPEGLVGEDIPLNSRIISVVDAYYAMINDRPYRKAYSKEEAKEELIKEKGKQFDPKIVDIFIEVL